MLIHNSGSEEDLHNEDDTDLYNFAFTNISHTWVQPIIHTQEIILFQESKGKKIITQTGSY